MPISRRAFLGISGAATLSWAERLAAQATASRVFQHGVASGDPLTDRVVIWTRVTPRQGMTARAVRVRWQMMTDAEAPVIVRRGELAAAPARDFTVKLDVGGLEPGRTYTYQFEAEGEQSAVGRTKTIARTTSQLRLAVVCCSNYPAGYFNAYRAIAERGDIDAVVHLGDYVYEFANGTFGDGSSIDRMPDPPHEVVTLDDYRRRYGIYRRDVDLQALHHAAPMIAIWDDHEFADNAWFGGYGSGQVGWNSRRRAAIQAYREWMPIRERVGGATLEIYRHVQFGSLAGLTMLDTRSLRDAQTFVTDDRALRDPRRRVLGAQQEAWLDATLRSAVARGTKWSLVGQQVMFSPFASPELPKNPDAWDGYQAERDRVRELFGRAGNVAILTGDAHSSWAIDVPRDPWSGYTPESGQGSLAVELIAPAVSSQPYFTGNQEQTLGPGIRSSMPHLKFLDGEHRGFILLNVLPSRLEASWHFTPDVLRRSAVTQPGPTFIVEAGSMHLQRGS